MHPNAARVQAALDEAGSTARVLELAESTHTSADAASAVGCEVAQIAKTLVFLADGAPVVAVLSGVDRCDTGRLADVVGATSITRPDAELVRAATGFSIGGVSPLGLDGMPVVLDAGLAGTEPIWVAGGTPNAVFSTSFEELRDLARAIVADIRVL